MDRFGSFVDGPPDWVWHFADNLRNLMKDSGNLIDQVYYARLFVFSDSRRSCFVYC